MVGVGDIPFDMWTLIVATGIAGLVIYYVFIPLVEKIKQRGADEQKHDDRYVELKSEISQTKTDLKHHTDEYAELKRELNNTHKGLHESIRSLEKSMIVVQTQLKVWNDTMAENHKDIAKRLSDLANR